MIRKKYIVNGRVQGVGFRPFVYRLAREHGLSGMVQNTSEGVIIEVQGERNTLDLFASDLQTKHPPIAEIISIQDQEVKSLSGEKNFSIISSAAQDEHRVLISPDWAVCSDCTREILDPDDRRYLYPFTNCTNCGPRYTITARIPYDRKNTSMAVFNMCSTCLSEYSDPGDRRFHAQPNACPKCGPGVWLTDHLGSHVFQEEDPLEQSALLLKQGRILALKGLGGFHLACNAFDHDAVKELRRRKNRPHKSLALMVPDLMTAKRLAELNPLEQELMQGPIRPILTLEPKPLHALSPALSPDTNRIGIMTAYTPLHLVLFEHLKRHLSGDEIPALVMTSGNLGSEPICLGNAEALERLYGIADYFLLHNRDILVRCDDSVLFVNGQDRGYYRRARGYVPEPVFLNRSGATVLGVGPELKNTICLTKQDQAFVSQHIGDLKNLETYTFFRECISHLQHILRVNPRAAVCDLHPDYMSTRFAKDESGLQVFALQHHFAHILSVMAENLFQGPCIGLALDGSGLGPDGTLWGGELLLVDNRDMSMKRLGHFQPVPLPGGDSAVLEPWRIAAGYLFRLGLDDFLLENKENPAFSRNKKNLKRMLEQNINSPLSTGCGRLYDAVAALLGLVHNISYEGQGAIILEKIQSDQGYPVYDVPILETEQGLILDTLVLFEQICRDKSMGISYGVISRRFHLSLAGALSAWARTAADKTGVKNIALSGGVMQNLTLEKLLKAGLYEASLNVLTHKLLPPNDACISLGQAVYGQYMLERGLSESPAAKQPDAKNIAGSGSVLL